MIASGSILCRQEEFSLKQDMGISRDLLKECLRCWAPLLSCKDGQKHTFLIASFYFITSLNKMIR